VKSVLAGKYGSFFCRVATLASEKGERHAFDDVFEVMQAGPTTGLKFNVSELLFSLWL